MEHSRKKEQGEILNKACPTQRQYVRTEEYWNHYFEMYILTSTE